MSEALMSRGNTKFDQAAYRMGSASG